MVSILQTRSGYDPYTPIDPPMGAYNSRPPKYDCSNPPPNVRMACGRELTGPKLINSPRNWEMTLPAFKKGGRVKRTGKAIVHKGEYILPKGVKPTKAQVKKVNAMKKRK